MSALGYSRHVTNAQARMAVGFAVWLVFEASAHGEPKCFIFERTVHGLSPDGRYALTSSTDHFGLVDLALVDLEEGRNLLSGSVYESDFETLDVSELMDVGRLELRPTAEWAPWQGSWSKLRDKLKARCGAVAFPEEAQDNEVDPKQLIEVRVGTKNAVLTFDLGKADGCDGTTGKVVAAVACGKTRSDERQGLATRILASGHPTKVLAVIAGEVYRHRHDPLTAYDLVMQFWKRLDAKAINPELGLAIESDRTLYLSQLGWLGHVECRALERDLASRFGAIWQSPSSPAVERLKKSIAFNFSKCRDQNSGR